MRLRGITPFAAALLGVALLFGGSSAAFARSKTKKESKAKQEQTASKVDLNTASEADLEALPGIGAATAKKIIDNRPYKSLADARDKAGISESTMDKIRPMVKVSRSSARDEDADKTTAKKEKSEATESSSATTPPETASSSSPAEMPQSDAGANQAAPAPGSGMVWVNTDTKVFHREGDRWYGKTKHGKYMSEADAVKAGYRPAKTRGDKDNDKE